MRTIALPFVVFALAGCGAGSQATSAPVVVAPPAVAAPSPVPQWLWTGVGFPEHVAFTADGQTLVVVSGDAATAIDASTGHARAWLPLDAGWARHATPSRDGHTILTGGGAWSLDGREDGLPGAALYGALDSLGITGRPQAAVLAGAERFVVFGEDHTYLADASGRVLVRDLEPTGLEAPLDPTGRTFLVDGDHVLLVGSEDGAVRATFDGGPYLVAYSSDGQRLLVAARGSLLSIDVATGAVRARMDHGGGLFGLSPGAEWALVRREGRCVLVDGATLAIAAEAPCAETTEFPALVSAAGTFVADPYGAALELVDLRAGTSLRLADAGARALAITPDGARVLLRTDHVSLVDPRLPEPLWSMPRRTTLPVRDVHALDGHLFVSTSDRTWDVRPDGTTHVVACGFGDPYRAPHGIVLECVDGTHVDAASGEVRIPQTIALDRSEDGRVVVAVTDEGFDVFDLESGRTQAIAATSFAGGPVLWASHALSRDGSRMVISDVTSVRVVDPLSGDSMASIPAHDDALVAFVEDDRRVLVTHVDGSVTLHESSSLALVATLPPAPGTAGLFGLDASADEYVNGSVSMSRNGSYARVLGRGLRVVHVAGDALREGILLRDEGVWMVASGEMAQHLTADYAPLETRSLPDGALVSEPPWLITDDGTPIRCRDGALRGPSVDRALAPCDYMNVVPSHDGRFVTERSETVAHVSRVQTGDRLWISIVRSGDEDSLALWDDAGHAWGPEGLVLERDADGVLRPAEQVEVVAAFLAER
jgi:hypothetical protein